MTSGNPWFPHEPPPCVRSRGLNRSGSRPFRSRFSRPHPRPVWLSRAEPGSAAGGTRTNSKLTPGTRAEPGPAPGLPGVSTVGRRKGHEFIDVDESQDPPGRWRHEAPSWVCEPLRIAELDHLPARLDLAAPCSQDVADPIALRSVGQRKDVATAVSKDVHRRAVGTTGATSDVDDDRESRHPSRQAAGDAVRHTAVEVSELPW
jgi:hypothetical protein